MSKKKKAARKTPFRFQIQENPFAGVSEQEIDELINSLAANSETGFHTAVEELASTLAQTDPQLLLSSFAYYALSYDGITREADLPLNLVQHHVELLQTFYLMNPLASYESTPVLGDNFEKISELLKDVSITFSYKRLKTFRSGQSEREKKTFSIQEYLRLHTQFVRNWGYPEQIERIVKELFGRLDTRVEARLGIRIEHLVTACFKLIFLVEERINKHLRSLASILKLANYESMVNKYSEVFLDGVENSGINSEKMREVAPTLKHLRYALLQHSNLFLEDIYTFTVAEFAELYPTFVESNTLNRILDNWSFAFGDLANRNIEHCFMANPIWTRPLIKLDDDTYFLPIAGLFISFCLELMESVLKLENDLWEFYNDERGEFLEDILEQLLRSTFVNAPIYRGSQFPDSQDTSKIYENDFLVIVDTFAIVIEAKSGRVRPESRRGALDSLKTNLDDLLVESSEQAQRFIGYLQDHPSCSLSTKRGVVNEIDVTNVKTFCPLNITFEMLGAISAYTRTLKEADLVAQSVQLVPSTAFPDFEIVIELLEDSLQILHYLQWRSTLGKNTHFHADEIDLLALYVQDGFMQAAMTGEEYFMNIYGESELLNPYFLRQHHDQKIEKPRRRFTELWQKLLSILKTEKPNRWVELGCVLLDFEYEKQKDFELKLKSAMREVVRDSRKLGHVRVTTFSGVSVHALVRKDLSLERSEGVINAYLEQLLEQGTSGSQAVLVLEGSSKALKDSIRAIYLQSVIR